MVLLKNFGNIFSKNTTIIDKNFTSPLSIRGWRGVGGEAKNTKAFSKPIINNPTCTSKSSDKIIALALKPPGVYWFLTNLHNFLNGTYNHHLASLFNMRHDRENNGTH
jgi:hypothetical protein